MLWGSYSVKYLLRNLIKKHKKAYIAGEVLGFCKPFFKQTTYDRWRQLHDKLVSTLTLTQSDPLPLKGHCHEDFAVLGQLCAKTITLRL